MRSVRQIAEEISMLLPKLLRGMRAGFIASPALTTSQLIVLLAVYDKGTVRTCELSRVMHVSAPTITGIVDRLVRAKYLKRIPDEKDRRAINIELTKKGAIEANNFLVAVRNRWKAVLIHLKPNDREMYLSILKKILNVLERKDE
jgi:DNA-binding MarR family transcriptional regulator